jgi:hypothetical protein
LKNRSKVDSIFLSDMQLHLDVASRTIALHKNARTTPATFAEMATSSETAATLALRYGVSEGTVYKWRGLQLS